MTTLLIFNVETRCNASEHHAGTTDFYIFIYKDAALGVQTRYNASLHSGE